MSELNVVAEARKKKGWSQTRLADELNVKRQAVWRWENDETIPTMNHMFQLHNKLGIPLDDLMDQFNKNK